LNSLIVTIHIIACIVLVVLVLLQSGKEGMGVIFGGGGGTLFGASGAGNLLSKLTAGAATVFFVTSMLFTYISTQQHVTPKESIVLDMPVNEAPAQSNTVPAVPGTQNAQQPAEKAKTN